MNDAADTRQGTGLCLSGGGYRAMLFHAGAVLRLDELGLLSRLDFVSSVSGGSITAAMLASRWNRLRWNEAGVSTNLRPLVVDPLLAFAGRTIDQWAVVGSLLVPGLAASDVVASAYRKFLYGRTTLADLPDRPRFIFTATNLQSGALWRFSKSYLRDYRVGRIASPRTDLSIVVAASSAFPPLLSPLTLRPRRADWTEVEAGLGDPFREKVILADGGVYDNLGLEPVIKRCAMVLVSDGGGRLKPVAHVSHSWVRQYLRVLGVIDQQVRNLRLRWLHEDYEQGEYDGVYWSIRSTSEELGHPSALSCSAADVRQLAETPTRLAPLTPAHRRRLVNWGYAACDAAVRSRVLPQASAPAFFPYADGVSP